MDGNDATAATSVNAMNDSVRMERATRTRPDILVSESLGIPSNHDRGLAGMNEKVCRTGAFI